MVITLNNKVGCTFEALSLMTYASVLVSLSAHYFLPFPLGVLFEVYLHQQPLVSPTGHLKHTEINMQTEYNLMHLLFWKYKMLEYTRA